MILQISLYFGMVSEVSLVIYQPLNTTWLANVEFYYQHDELYCEGLSLLEIASKATTPCFVYSKHDLEENCRVFRQAFDQVGMTTHLRYAVKAASNLALLQIIFKAGYGADVVSQGEIMRALTAGLNAEKLFFQE